MEVERSHFTITVNDLRCPEQYVVDGRNLLRRGDSIIYEVGRYIADTENIFYGPYWTLPPAVYFFWFNGELHGELKIDFADQHGRIILRERLINAFSDPLCLAVTQLLARFEVRGYRTPSLRTLRLDSVAVEAIRFAASAQRPESSVGQKTSFAAGPATLRRNISRGEIDLYADMLAEMQWRPRFCVIVIVDDDGCGVIERARGTIASVCSQAYPDWRVILVGDAATVSLRDRLADGRDDIRTLLDRLLNRGGEWDALSAQILSGFAGFRERIEISALGRTDPLYRFGEYDDQPQVFLGILAAGDELSCDAFLELAMTSGLNGDCDFFYSDELCINPITGMLEEFLKPQWSPDLLLSTNYIGRFWAAKRELLGRAEITLTELLHLGEYDAILRCTEQSRGIRHIPSVLCKATPRRLDSEAGMKRSLQRAVERRGIQGEITAGYRSGTFRLRRWVAPDLVSIIISTCASKGLVKPCIASLREITAHPNFEIVCIDNIPAAEKHLKDWLRANADQVIEIDVPFNWSYFNNRGAAAARGPLLLFLNDDAEITEPGWLDVLVEHAQRPEVGVVGAQLLYPNRTVQHGGMFLARLGHARHAFRHRRQDDPGYFGLASLERNVSAVTGACLMTRREIFADLGGFNEAHDIINNDLDYCLKARARGLLCVYTPYAKLVHHEGASRAASEHYDYDAFNSQWWTSFGDEAPPARLPEFYGDILRWSSDVYHHDGDDVWRAIETMKKYGLPKEDRAKFLGANARRLYKVQAPANIIRGRVTEIERPDWWPTDEEVRAALRPEAAVTRG